MLLRELLPDLVQPQATMLSDDVVLLTLHEDTIDHAPALTPPYGTVAVRGSAGDYKIAAMRLPARPDGRPHALVAMAEMAEIIEIAEELDQESCRRLLGFLLGFCRKAFGLAGSATFIKLCIRLSRFCAKEAGTTLPVAYATSSWMVLKDLRAPAGATLYLLQADRVRQSAAPAMTDGGGLCLVEAVREGDLVLALCERPLFWIVRPSGTTLPNVLKPSGSVDASVPASLRAACLRALAPVGGTAAALLREMQVLSPVAPRRHDDWARPIGAALEVALPDGEGGLFLRGWLRDPLDLVADIEIRTPVGAIRIDADLLHRIRRPDVGGRYKEASFHDDVQRPGFVAHVRDPSDGLCAQPNLVLRLRSGNLMEVTAPLRHLPPTAARDAVLSCVPPAEVTPRMLDECLGPVAAALHRQTLAGRGVAETVQIGTPLRRPDVTMIVPLYRNLDFVRFQVAAFAADPECREAELVYVLDSPDQRGELEHLLRGLNALHGMPFTLQVMPCNLGYAAANNTAAATARGSSLLLLNSDVVPARPGWLSVMRAALAVPGVGAVGPKLLFDDGSIQHAGLFFERDGEGVWFNAHYHKGMPRHWPAAQRKRRVPGVTGAALLVKRALFRAVGGICEDYIIGDYEDSDFCLRLREAGSTIAYVPEAELYHFERRSIELHAGYTRTLASLYNRRLHHGRWAPAITDLMRQRAHRSAA